MTEDIMEDSGPEIWVSPTCKRTIYDKQKREVSCSVSGQIWNPDKSKVDACTVCGAAPVRYLRAIFDGNSPPPKMRDEVFNKAWENLQYMLNDAKLLEYPKEYLIEQWANTCWSALLMREYTAQLEAALRAIKAETE